MELLRISFINEYVIAGMTVMTATVLMKMTLSLFSGHLLECLSSVGACYWHEWIKQGEGKAASGRQQRYNMNVAISGIWRRVGRM
jgi:hypothetical protein